MKRITIKPCEEVLRLFREEQDAKAGLYALAAHVGSLGRQAWESTRLNHPELPKDWEISVTFDARTKEVFWYEKESESK